MGVSRKVAVFFAALTAISRFSQLRKTMAYGCRSDVSASAERAAETPLETGCHRAERHWLTMRAIVKGGAHRLSESSLVAVVESVTKWVIRSRPPEFLVEVLTWCLRSSHLRNVPTVDLI